MNEIVSKQNTGCWITAHLAAMILLSNLGGQLRGEETPDGSPNEEKPIRNVLPDDLLPDLIPATEDSDSETRTTEPEKDPDDNNDPVTLIGEKMRLVETLLRQPEADGNPQTGPLQEQIVRELKILIELLDKQAQQQSSSNSSSSAQQTQQQASSRSQVKQPAEQQGESKEGHQKDKPSRDSAKRLGKATPQVNLVELTEVVKEIWGHLPEKDRERLRQLSADQVMPGHDVAVEKYFRRLAEETDDQNAPK